MPEAEDVLLEAAERAIGAARAVWRRRRAGAGFGEGPPEGSAERRLVLWQAAWLGRSWPVAAAQPLPSPGTWVRWLRRLPPWIARERAAPFTDGAQIWLPAGCLEPVLGSARSKDTALLATLGLARRLARGSDEAPARMPRFARDLCWLLEAALGDIALARAWPGLAHALRAVRRDALGTRPPPRSLHPLERVLEAQLREWLAAAPDRLPGALFGNLAPESAPRDIAEFAARRGAELRRDASGPYRGFAPVLHWGTAHPRQHPANRPAPAPSSTRCPRPGRSLTLTRPLQRRAPDPDSAGNRAPFVLPFADPHLSVDDPGASQRPQDRGHDEELDALAQELARLESLPVVPDGSDAREILDIGSPLFRASAPVTPAEGTADSAWLYPEWDASRGAYRFPGTRVRELHASLDDRGWADATLLTQRHLIARCRRQLETLRPRRERLRRQSDGDGLDLSAWIEDWTDARAGQPPTGRVYTQEQRQRREVAVALLLDTSGSTESWLCAQRRVIDVIKEAALVFSEALAALGDRFALHAFCSQGSLDVRVRTLKRFGEAHSAQICRRIGALEPDASTRLGAALRHASARLARERARARVLLLLSDGKPHDDDGYAGSYAIDDARQAVAEAHLQDLHVFALAVDREGPAYLSRIFGPHGYTVLWNAAALPERLPAIYRRLTAAA